MKLSTLALYGKEADNRQRFLDHQPVVLGGPGARLSSLAFCNRFNRDAHYSDIRDSSGILRWVTQKQMRVYGIVARISLSPDGRARMVDIAVEAQCCTSTVSRTLLKLQAWGLYGVDVRRGRNGGITIRRPFGTWAKAYIAAARQKLREMAFRARIKLASKIQGQETGSSSYLLTMDASFSRRTLTFAERVVYERAYLALEDPEGEREARNPLRKEEAEKLLDWRQREPAEVAQLREDAIYRKAIEDGDGDLVYRIGVDRTMRAHAAAGRWDKWQALADLLFPERVHGQHDHR